jgi:hypothetical protein
MNPPLIPLLARAFERKLILPNRPDPQLGFPHLATYQDQRAQLFQLTPWCAFVTKISPGDLGHFVQTRIWIWIWQCLLALCPCAGSPARHRPVMAVETTQDEEFPVGIYTPVLS